MNSKDGLCEDLKKVVIAGDRENAPKLVEDVLREGLSPTDIIEHVMSPAMKEVGERFARYEIYLPEMMLSAEAWEWAMKVLEPKLLEEGKEKKNVGKVVIGTVAGDIHSIGKDIVGSMLKMVGFEVYDLGIDVPASSFVSKAEEVKADVIAISALMSSTIMQQKEIIEHLNARGVRNKYKVLVGGGSASQKWADQIEADGYGQSAGDAVEVALRSVGIKGGQK